MRTSTRTRSSRLSSGYPGSVSIKDNSLTQVNFQPRQSSLSLTYGAVNEDYEAIFPEDPYGEEAGPNARVFRVYNEEAAVYDADMIGQCSDSSDVLLVFVRIVYLL